MAENAMEPVREKPAPPEEMDRAYPPQPRQDAEAGQDTTFEIAEFKLEGNTLFTKERLSMLLDDLAGPRRTADDVEKAREILEKFHHEEGFPTVIVNIPEQKVEEGVIRLEIIESRVSDVRVTGNRHFTTEQILDKLPSLSPGTLINARDVEKEIGRVNRNPDLKVMPTAMTPGKDLGTIEVDLKAEDHLPFHGSFQIDNSSSHNTTPLRIDMGAHYDNLWSMDHSLSLQYQFTPQKFEEVEVVSASYLLPLPWNRDHSIVVYGLYSNSNTVFGDSFHSLGKGKVIGVRYVASLPSYGSLYHSAIFGFDYKDFKDTTSQFDALVDKTPVEYMPLSLAYNGSVPDSTGLTMFNAGFNMAFRGLIAREQEFENKRFKARANYFYVNLGAQRQQKLPFGASLGVKLDGQIADQPLISNEQYSAGGMESVRGYKESEAMGDSAFHGQVELVSPDLAPKFGLGERFQITPYGFYDFAVLILKDPLDQPPTSDIQGAGAGIRGILFKGLEFQTDWAYALVATNKIKKGDQRVYFKLKYVF
jgi:hemolysin activation/secretion protein